MLSWITLILVLVGAINWGLFALLHLDIVELIFGGKKNPIGRLIYVLIGLSGLYTVFRLLFH